MSKYLTDGKLKTLTFFVFEIKGAKKDKIDNFLNDRFSVTGGPMDMIFGAFLEIYLRLLKSIVSQFFSKYSKSYNNLIVKMLKIQEPLKKRRAVLGPPNYMELIELYKSFLEWYRWRFWHLYFLRYWAISFPCETLYTQITADVGKITKTVQRDLTFIFDVISEYVIYFVSNAVS